MVDLPRVHEDAELAELAGASVLTSYQGKRASLDKIRLLGRPGLYDAVAGWRLLTGPDRRPPEPLRDRQSTRIAA